MAGLFDDLLQDGQPAAGGLFDDLLSDDSPAESNDAQEQFRAGERATTPARQPRRGGTRAEARPFVADGTWQPGEAGGGRGFVNTEADLRRAAGYRPLTLEQSGKDVQGSVEDAKALAEGAGLFFKSAGYQRARTIFEQFDRIDAGQAPTLNQSPGSAVNSSPAHSWTRTYEGASPDGRAKMREELTRQMASDRDVINASLAAIDAYKKESQRLKGEMPDLTQARGLRDFGVFLARHGLANSANMAATMALAATGGVPGAATGIAGMGLGDLMGDVAERATSVTDPQRFTNPDRREAAAAAAPDLAAAGVADSRNSVAAALPAYMLGDVLSPEALLARRMGAKAPRTMRQAVAQGAKDTAVSLPGEALGEAEQAAVSMATQAARGERPTEIRDEDINRLINEAGGGLAGAGMAGPIHVGAGAARVAQDNARLTAAAEQGDVAAAVELAARRGEIESRAATSPVAQPPAVRQPDQPAPPAPQAPAQPSILDTMGVTRVQAPQTSAPVSAPAVTDDDFISLNDEIASLERAAGIADDGAVASGATKQSSATAGPVEASGRADAAAADVPEIVDTWSGAKGRGFATEAEAMLALPRRQREKPGLDWSPEPIGDTGRWQLVGRGVRADDVEAARQPMAESALFDRSGATHLERVEAIDRELSRGAADSPQAQALRAERQALTRDWPAAVPGAKTIFSTEAGARVAAQFALVDADELVTSHHESLRPNAAYPQDLQPRQRERAASAAQIGSIVQRLDPARLGTSADAGTGAPIVGADGLVESGNARTIALKRIYGVDGKTADDYRAWLREHAQQFGLQPEQVDGLAKPVLVRVRTTPVNRAEFARQANASTVAQMSPAEQARADASRIDALDDLQPDEQGDFATSRDFIRRFIARLPMTEQAGMIDAAGQLSSAGYARVRNAVLAKAYGDSPVLARMVESMDDRLRNVSRALMIAAPTVAQARASIDAGARHDADVTPHLVQAVEALSRLKEQGVSVEDALAQAGIFGDEFSRETRALLAFLGENMRRPRRIAEFIKAYFDALDAVGDPRQDSLLGDAAPPTKGELIDAARRATQGDSDDRTRQAGRAGSGEAARSGARDRGQSEDAPRAGRSGEEDGAAGTVGSAAGRREHDADEPQRDGASGRGRAARGGQQEDGLTEPQTVQLARATQPIAADTERAYGGRDAYERARAAGRTRLSYPQWVTARTTEFKAWFGDWEALRAQQRLDAMEPLRVSVPDQWRGLPVDELREKVRQAMQSLRDEPLHHPEIGDVQVTVGTGIKKPTSEGRDPAKLLVLADLRNAFEGSIFASASPPQRIEPGVAAYEKLLARVSIDSSRLVAIFTVRRMNDGRQFYNAFVLQDDQKETPTVSPGDTPIAGERAAPADVGVSGFVRRALVRVNPATVSKAIDRDTGEPLESAIDAFDASRADTSLSRAGQGVPLSRGPGQMTAVAHAIADQLAATGVRVNVADSVSDMPPDRKAALLSKDPTGRARGAYFPASDEVWVIASNISSADEMVFVVMHEAFHRGLQITFGERGAEMLRRMYATNSRVRELADEQMRRYGIGKEEAVNEALADLAGSGEAQALNGWGKLARMVREWAAKIARAAGVELSWSDARVLDLVANLTKAGLRGQPAVDFMPADTALASVPDEYRALRALSENDELFALPKSDKDTVEGIAADIDPQIKVTPRNIPGEQRWDLQLPSGKTTRLTVRKPNPYGPTLYGFDQADGELSNVFDGRPGENPEDVDPGTEDVFIDASLLESGNEGSKVYQIAATFAHNTGRIFIGDPAGLSDAALVRRPEQMLSSALKFGTTRHLAPHPRQTVGDARLGVPALKWVYGDDLGNIRRLIDLNLKVLENAGLADAIRFDPANGQFLDSEGAPLSRGDIRLLAETTDLGRAAGAGDRTLARGAVLRALLREAGGEGEAGGGRDGLLARLAGLGNSRPAATKGILYSRAGGRAKHTPEQLAALARAGRSRVDRSAYDGIVVRQQIRIADTGEVATLTMDAGRALRRLDERAETFRKVLDCLSR